MCRVLCCDAVGLGTVVRTLPEAEPICGVTSLDNRLYVLRGKFWNQIEVYDINSYRLRSYLNVPGIIRYAHDIVACGHNRCAYVSDPFDDAVHRLELRDGEATQWPVNDEPVCLSLNPTHGVLVACAAAHTIKRVQYRRSTTSSTASHLTITHNPVVQWGVHCVPW